MPRATSAVGRNVLRKEGCVESRRLREATSTTSRSRTSLHARTIRSTIPAGEIAADPLATSTRAGFTDRRLPRHPGPQRRRADRRRSAVPRRSARSVMSPSRSCCWRTRIASTLLAADVQIDYVPSTPHLRSGGVADRVQDDQHRRRATSPTVSRSPITSSRASTGSGIRSSSTSSRTA